jgi:DNA/RNA-binding domain of Phe-tRNA-synthetase-like protein
MQELPFSVRIELSDWQLFWASVEIERQAEAELAKLRAETAEGVRQRFSSTGELSSHPAVAAMRRLFRAAGTDPTRYRPASEALARRLIKGSDLPAIQPLVDINNCLSADLLVPCCVMTEGKLGSSLLLRAGRPGESYTSLRGPFNLEGRPLLTDENGPLDTPITGNERVMVHSETRRAWLVAYLPAATVSADQAWSTLESYQSRSGVLAIRYQSSTWPVR